MTLPAEVQGAIVGGAIGIFSASVTAIVNHHNLKRRLQSKNERRLAEFYLEKKVDVLTEIHTELTGCYVSLGKALQNPSGYSWDAVESTIRPDIDSLENAVTMGDVYLTSEQESALRATVEQYRAVADKIAILETGRQDMIDDVYDATERAGGTLAQEIDRPIRRLEGTDRDSEGSEESTAERRAVPSSHDSSRWAVLATQRNRIREVVDVASDGTIEVTAEVSALGRAMLVVVGRRYAYERDLVESPTVSTDELETVLEDTSTTLESFEDEADGHLMSDDGEYFVEAEEIEGAIDWASTYVESDGLSTPEE